MESSNIRYTPYNSNFLNFNHHFYNPKSISQSDSSIPTMSLGTSSIYENNSTNSYLNNFPSNNQINSSPLPPIPSYPNFNITTSQQQQIHNIKYEKESLIPPPNTIPVPQNIQHQQQYHTNTKSINSNHFQAQLQKNLDETLNNFWGDQIDEISNVNDFKNVEIPLARIKKIMRSNEGVNKVASEVPILFAKACEMIILEMSHRAWVQTEMHKRRTLQSVDITNGVSRSEMFDFLIDFLPRDEVKSFKKAPHSMLTPEFFQFCHLQLIDQQKHVQHVQTPQTPIPQQLQQHLPNSQYLSNSPIILNDTSVHTNNSSSSTSGSFDNTSPINSNLTPNTQNQYSSSSSGNYNNSPILESTSPILISNNFNQQPPVPTTVISSHQHYKKLLLSNSNIENSLFESPNTSPPRQNSIDSLNHFQNNNISHFDQTTTQNILLNEENTRELSSSSSNHSFYYTE